MSYILAGAMYPINIEGNFVPDGNLQGYYQVAGELLTHDTQTGYDYRTMSNGDLTFHWSAGALKSFINTPPWGKVICTAFWKNTLNQECSFALVNTNALEIYFVIKNITLNETVFNAGLTMSLLQFIIDDPTDNLKEVYIGLTKSQTIPGQQDDPKYLTVAAWSGNLNVAAQHPYIYSRAGQFVADSESELAIDRIAYNMFSDMGVKDKDIGDPSEPSPPGSGSFMYDDHPIDFPDAPTLSAVGTGFVGLYKLTSENVKSLGEFLWGPNFFDQIIKNFASPFENIISFHILPLDITGMADTIKIGNINTLVPGQRLSGQFLDANFGFVRIPKIFGNQLDFEPASSCEIYLPYIGYKNIDLDPASGGTLTLRYRIDLLTGECVAMVKVTQTDRYSHNSCEYLFNGNCAVPIPLSGSSYMGLFGNLVGGITSAAVSAGIGNVMGVAGGVSSIFNSKPEYQRSGNIASTPGYLGIQDAFVLLNSPVQSIAGNIKHLEGLRSNVNVSFSGLSGFQKIESYTPTTGLAAECTAEELQEIKNLLMEGVYF